MGSLVVAASAAFLLPLVGPVSETLPEAVDPVFDVPASVSGVPAALPAPVARSIERGTVAGAAPPSAPRLPMEASFAPEEAVPIERARCSLLTIVYAQPGVYSTTVYLDGIAVAGGWYDSDWYSPAHGARGAACGSGVREVRVVDEVAGVDVTFSTLLRGDAEIVVGVASQTARLR